MVRIRSFSRGERILHLVQEYTDVMGYLAIQPFVQGFVVLRVQHRVFTWALIFRF